MAIIVNSSTFSGHDSTEIIEDAVSMTSVISKLKTRYITSAKCNYRFATQPYGGTLEAYECCNPTGGNSTFPVKEGTMCNYQFKLSFCSIDLDCTIFEQLKAQGLNKEAANNPAYIEAILVSLIRKNVARGIDYMALNGGSLYGTTCLGLLAQWDADPDVTTVGGTTITSANIKTEIDKIFAARDVDLILEPQNLTLVVSTEFITAFEAFITQPGQYYNPLPGDNINYRWINGTPLVAMPGMPANTAFLTNMDNIIIVTDSTDDFNNVAITNMADSDAFCDEVRLRAKFRFDINYGISRYIVYYKP